MDKQVIQQHAESLIQICGNQAYHKAVLLASLSTNLGDKEWAELYSQVAIELMQNDYHKFEKEEK